MSHIVQGWSLVTASIVLCGCVARMQQPEGLGENPVTLAVAGRDATDPFAAEELSFGSYRAYSIARGFSISAGGGDFFGAHSVDLKTFPTDDSFSYSLATERGPWRAVCTTSSEVVAIETPGEPLQTTTENMTCICVNLSGKTSAKMQLATDRQVYTGVITIGDTALRVIGSRLVEGSGRRADHATGYVFADGARPMAVVDVLNTGVVWFRGALPELQRDALACASVGLLLHANP